MCGRHADEVDHIISYRNGGVDSMDNLQSLCYSHHKQKTLKEAAAGRAAVRAGRVRADSKYKGPVRNI